MNSASNSESSPNSPKGNPPRISSRAVRAPTLSFPNLHRCGILEGGGTHPRRSRQAGSEFEAVLPLAFFL